MIHVPPTIFKSLGFRLAVFIVLHITLHYLNGAMDISTLSHLKLTFERKKGDAVRMFEFEWYFGQMFTTLQRM